jgi:hypothetical protein
MLYIMEATDELIEKISKFCKIWGFQGGDYEECRLLGCGAV